MSFVKNDIVSFDQKSHCWTKVLAARPEPWIYGQGVGPGFNGVVKSLRSRRVIQRNEQVNLEQVLACLRAPNEPSRHWSVFS